MSMRRNDAISLPTFFRVAATTRSGAPFSPATVNSVWESTPAVAGVDPAEWRQDAAGAWIRRSDYGLASDYGWEIDHVIPVSRGGLDTPNNLRPLQWRNNRQKSDTYPFLGPWAVTAAP
jgi:HNH endonuclease